MSIRFTEDIEFRAPDSPPPLHFVGALLIHLDVVEASQEDALEAIRGWLRGNRPSSTLVADLEVSEYAEALDALAHHSGWTV